ncbi:MAG: HDIG domain-containing protein [Porphyromonadaceae bacterium]|nr:HDIG domain-containing protein [Porphyromonadaceae bacterium]
MKIGLFIAVVSIIVLLFPKDMKFKYQYEIGKPWTYELMTASFDFPIYKTEQQLEADRQELLTNYTPYFQMDNNVADQQIGKWLDDWRLRNPDDPTYRGYVERKLKDIYQKGVVSVGMLTQLKSDDRKSIAVVDKNRKTETKSVDELYTPKTAYEELLLDKPNYVDSKEISSYNLNLYIVENLRYDSITSMAVKEDMIQNLSLTSGMVQTGERIIDRGEIISPGTFAILNSMKIESQKRNSIFKESGYVIIAELIIVFGLILMLSLYLHLFRINIFESVSNLIFIAILILLIVSLSAIIIKYSSWGVYIVPFTLLPVIIRVFFDSRTALFTHIITVLIISLMVDNPFTFILIQILAGMTAVSGLKDLTARSQLTQTALFIFISYCISYLALELFAEGDILRLNFKPIIYFAISSILLLFAYVLIYLFEKIFGLVSSITLVELTNINSDLMMRFAEEAPGTFQHSLQVSNLATEAAKKINANSLLVRTGALYHDIGKMKNPQYFIENQVGDNNPLLKMSYEEASQAIIQHVPDGVAIAKKHHLPEQIIGFIATHHGRTKTKFFYNSFVNENPNVKPDEEKFTYPGPLPYSKESAILMMADAIEARSRTLGVYTEKSITDMVESMIDTQIAEGQFKDAPISFKDVETVKSVLAEKIMNIYHSRISYPELNP